MTARARRVERVPAARVRRIWAYAAASVCVLSAYVGLEFVPWRGGAQLHTILEVVATLIALVVGVVSLVRYYAHNSNLYLITGAGFIGVALLDGYHAVVTSEFFSHSFPSVPATLIPWSWNASRTFLAVLMFISWLLWRRGQKLGATIHVSKRAVFGTVGLLTLTCFSFFAFVPLPQAEFPNLIFGRPEEFVSAVFFLVALAGYLKKTDLTDDGFDHWITLSLLVGFLAQAVVMSRSFQLFDAMFDFAHLLKIISYVCVLCGLLASMYQLFQQAERSEKLIRTNEALREEIQERQRVQSALRTSQGRLELLQALNRGTLALSASRSVEEAMQTATDRIREIIGAHQAVTRLIPGASWKQPIQTPSLSDRYAEFRGFAVPPDGSGIYAWVMESDRAVRMTQAETEAHPRWRGYRDRNGTDYSRRHPPMRGWLAAPLKGQDGRSLGVMQLSDKFVGEFTEEDEEILKQFAQLVAYAIEILQYKEMLEARVEQRTRELSRANLRLQAQNKELDEFAYVASHDLKAPLRAINNLAKWIAEDVGPLLPDGSAEHLEKMQQRVTRMEALLIDLLDYSRAGRSGYEHEVVDTKELVASIVEMLAPPATFTVSVADDMPVLTTPATPLRQVFLNLINNALKHHDRLDGLMEVSACDVGEYYEFVVTDDGPGIAPEFHQRIFRMFQTLQPRDEVEGTGMGLAVIKKLVESYGGGVHLDSEAGRGATFRFTWPKSARRCSNDSPTAVQVKNGR